MELTPTFDGLGLNYSTRAVIVLEAPDWRAYLVNRHRYIDSPLGTQLLRIQNEQRNREQTVVEVQTLQQLYSSTEPT